MYYYGTCIILVEDIVGYLDFREGLSLLGTVTEYVFGSRS
jgi:hypothetical protein